ncbi:MULTISPECIES: hypothetical protein [unclassified Micromonospora]|uniref:hypothetical protein n=1 Tax=unclassified Micromonospora TaxID=2617518 RepID=UPI00098D656F|nr:MULTISPECIES: hypothetical protein [unclassified Micromonospora]MDI5939903.1 hypothetical protein [Micromonospora sp. DH15]OON30591.1 hypothetical protein BSA16_15565 [Micromonospora sp. Rc5]
MSAGRPLVRVVAIGVLPAVLAFAAVYALRSGDGDGDGGSDRARPARTAATGGPPAPAGASGQPAGSTGPAGAVELAATLSGTAYSTELTFEVPEARARVSPPEWVRDCVRFAAWARDNGGVPVGPEPVHTLTLRARRSVDVQVAAVRAVPVAQVDRAGEQGPWVELACRDGVASPAASPPGRWRGGGMPHPLAAGQTLEVPVELDGLDESGGPVDPFPGGVSDYRLRVELEVDGVPQTYNLRDGDRDFRCCGRITYMGYQAARYEWTLAPARALRYCAELRYTGKPPPRTCGPRAPA